MKNLQRLIHLVICLLCCSKIYSQPIEPAILQKQWTASWVQVPGEPANSYGVYLFRKKLQLSEKPSSFRIHVSADNRYKLFVNEKLVSLGPARGDLAHWNFETVDIAPYLQSGNNIIAGLVWNEAELRPEAQISFRTGFIVQGATAAEQVINTNASWKCTRDSSYKPIRVNLQTYYVTGPGEFVNMAAHIKDWEKYALADSSWKNAQAIFPGAPKNLLGAYGISPGWALVPSILPQMEMTKVHLREVKNNGGTLLPAAFPSTKITTAIPANTTTTILLDQGYLTNAYPTIIFSGGKDGTITLGYAESLYSRYPEKGNRNETEGKQFLGRKDSLVCDGSDAQEFTSLNWRTYRYIQLHIVTKSQPLIIEDLYGTFTGYPFEYKANLQTNQPELKQFLEIGWRTARLCAVETYMDCPYYEQLQYIGDGRIQAMVSLYNSGDDRLVKNALNLMDQSRQPEGVTLSRHPSYSPQFIPTFSLWYIGILHDYWKYGKDSNFIKDKLPGERQVLSYFRRFQRTDGSLANVPYWMFTDWVTHKGWINGAAPQGADGSSSVVDLQLLLAYQTAADMENKSGMKEYATLYTSYATQLKVMIRKKYWDNSKGLFADTPEKDLFSQHANALAILTGTVTPTEAPIIAKKILADTSLAPASIYFKYYLHQALVKAGLGNDYISWLDNWRENIRMGLTTWAESPEISRARSDCHAWGSSPNIELFRTVLGIDSDAPGFTKVKIEPHLGAITDINGEIPHPNGKVAVFYQKNNNQWDVQINLPSKTTGSFIWLGKRYPLKEGMNSFRM